MVGSALQQQRQQQQAETQSSLPSSLSSALHATVTTGPSSSATAVAAPFTPTTSTPPGVEDTYAVVAPSGRAEPNDRKRKSAATEDDNEHGAVPPSETARRTRNGDFDDAERPREASGRVLHDVGGFRSSPGDAGFMLDGRGRPDGGPADAQLTPPYHREDPAAWGWGGGPPHPHPHGYGSPPAFNGGGPGYPPYYDQPYDPSSYPRPDRSVGRQPSGWDGRWGNPPASRSRDYGSSWPDRPIDNMGYDPRGRDDYPPGPPYPPGPHYGRRSAYGGFDGPRHPYVDGAFHPGQMTGPGWESAYPFDPHGYVPVPPPPPPLSSSGYPVKAEDLPDGGPDHSPMGPPTGFPPSGRRSSFGTGIPPSHPRLEAIQPRRKNPRPSSPPSVSPASSLSPIRPSSMPLLSPHGLDPTPAAPFLPPPALSSSSSSTASSKPGHRPSRQGSNQGDPAAYPRAGSAPTPPPPLDAMTPSASAFAEKPVAGGGGAWVWPPNQHVGKDLLVGTVFAEGQALTDLDGSKGGLFFVFSDLSIRVSGRFRIKFMLFDLQRTSPNSTAYASAVSETFSVFHPKDFPGMAASTELSRCFARQGVRIHIRSGGSLNVGAGSGGGGGGGGDRGEGGRGGGRGGGGASGRGQGASGGGAADDRDTSGGGGGGRGGGRGESGGSGKKSASGAVTMAAGAADLALTCNTTLAALRFKEGAPWTNVSV
ncbi:hypothetical protein HDU96_008811 [Phlyctochytrium bullatum]|nr:hypothetical protein HDU96_008811 [Phlyctochytrium bullatum]